MKKLDMNELNKLNNKELIAKKNELKRSFFDINFKKNTSGIEKPHLKKEYKKNIARIETVLNRKSK